MKTTRRQLLLGLVSCSVSCGGGGGAPAGGSSAGACAAPSDGSARRYCLLTAQQVRVPGGAELTSGQALLFNVDDATAVILARDDAGFYARSGICTHACCVVALCVSERCDELTPSPRACSPTALVTPDAAHGIVCPCHGSTFRLSDGKALTGPAVTALPSYAVSIDGSDALVDTGRLVDTGERA